MLRVWAIFLWIGSLTDKPNFSYSCLFCRASSYPASRHWPRTSGSTSSPSSPTWGRTRSFRALCLFVLLLHCISLTKLHCSTPVNLCSCVLVSILVICYSYNCLCVSVNSVCWTSSSCLTVFNPHNSQPYRVDIRFWERQKHINHNFVPSINTLTSQ